MLTSQLLQLYLAVLKSPVLKLSWVRLCSLQAHLFFMPSCTSDACEALNSWWPPLSALSEFVVIQFQFHLRTSFFQTFRASWRRQLPSPPARFPACPCCCHSWLPTPTIQSLAAAVQRERGHSPQQWGAGGGKDCRGGSSIGIADVGFSLRLSAGCITPCFAAP